MPAMTRLARNGHLRNSRTAASSCMVTSVPRAFRAAVLQGPDEQIDVVVEKLDVVGNGLFAADRRRDDKDLGARLAGDRVRRLLIEIWLHQDHLDGLPLHLLDEIERVPGRWRNARTRLDVADHLEAKAVD